MYSTMHDDLNILYALLEGYISLCALLEYYLGEATVTVNSYMDLFKHCMHVYTNSNFSYIYIYSCMQGCMLSAAIVIDSLALTYYS